MQPQRQHSHHHQQQQQQQLYTFSATEVQPKTNTTSASSSSQGLFNFGFFHPQVNTGERNPTSQQITNFGMTTTTNQLPSSTAQQETNILNHHSQQQNDLSWLMSLGMNPPMMLQQGEGSAPTYSSRPELASPISITAGIESLQNGLIDLVNEQQQQIQQLHQMQTDHDVTPTTTTQEHRNDSGSDHDEGHELPGGDFHSIACQPCRRLHRKCDKKLPSCSECIDKGKECCYRTPKKKGRTKGSKNKPKDAPSEQLPSSSSSPHESHSSPTATNGKSTKLSLVRKSTHPYTEINQSLLDGVVKRRTLDMFFDKMHGIGCGILSKEKVEKLALEYLANPEDEASSPYDNVNYKTHSMKNGVRCLLYSMQALCEQQMGFRETSQLAYREARKSLGSAFDDLDNFYIKVSYSLLSSYLAGEGDDATAKFYLNALNYAIQNTSTNYMSEGCQSISDEDEMTSLIALMNKNSLCCRYTDIHDLKIWDGFDTIYRLKTRKQSPYELDKLLQKGVTPDDVPMLLKLISLLNNVIEGYAHANSFSASQIQFTLLLKDIVCFGAEIVVYLSIGIDEGETVENLANKIINLTERESFAFLPVAMTHFVSLAAYIHGKMFPKIESIIGTKMKQGRAFHAIINDEYERNYFEMVNKGWRAMNSMATKFKRVTKYYGEVFNELEKIQQWKTKMENESYQAILEKRQASNFSSPKSTGTNDNVGLQQQLFPRSALLSSFNENPWGLRSQFSPQPTLQTTTTQQASNSNASYQSQFMKQFHPPLLTSMNSAAGTQRSPSVVSSSSPSSSMATPSFYNPHAMTSSQPVIIRPPQNPPQTPTHHQQQESSTLDEWLGMFGDPSEDDILGSLIGEIHQTLQNNF